LFAANVLSTPIAIAKSAGRSFADGTVEEQRQPLLGLRVSGSVEKRSAALAYILSTVA
jgi:hypothetical protein